VHAFAEENFEIGGDPTTQTPKVENLNWTAILTGKSALSNFELSTFGV
jgi:hypothetical protein